MQAEAYLCCFHINGIRCKIFLENIFEEKFLMIRTYKDLEVYKRSYSLAIGIKQLTSSFPSDERYLLKDQLNRSTRSIPANIAEGWAKRNYDAIFKRQLIDAIGSCAETEVHLQMALDFGYISSDLFHSKNTEIDEIYKMLYALHRNWKSHNFKPH